MPDRLSQTGIYTDMLTKALNPTLVAFVPEHVLWSDAAVKTRWYQIPTGAVIDASDMDRWRLPVGTKLFKEFVIDGKRLETRLIWRVADTGDRERDTLMGAFVWDDGETEAYFAKDGANDLRGTQHDAPAADTCWKCHVGEPGHALGLSALQIADLSSLPLSVQPAGAPIAAPNAALGYLHANCGHCHNPEGSAWADSSMVLRVGIGEHDAAVAQSVLTTVDVALTQWIDRGFTYRIVPGDPDQSAVFYRMTQRTDFVQMPPIATELPDPMGIALVRAWIEAL